jgi:hypothetical protein
VVRRVAGNQRDGEPLAVTIGFEASRYRWSSVISDFRPYRSGDTWVHRERRPPLRREAPVPPVPVHMRAPPARRGPA